MPGRSYRLLCPISRALDRIGDRWTLLILRDLHAGPARFSDLQGALPGIAPNLLTSRLRDLEEDGLVRRRDTEHRVSVYEVTELGARTDRVLYELATLGARFEPAAELKRPANLRTMAVTLKVACQRVAPPDLNLRAELVVDGESFALAARDGVVDLRYAAPEEPEVRVAMGYEDCVAVTEGKLSLEEFGANKVTVLSGDPGTVEGLMQWLAAAILELRGGGGADPTP